ncbi:hypothetical protein ACWERY_19545 [Streptomyces sp. NPDC004082]|uniref:hypothetical protein n=1 Tax=unclassified Streptomyces TaxID=2593676 RepID=UPI0033AF78A5
MQKLYRVYRRFTLLPVEGRSGRLVRAAMWPLTYVATATVGAAAVLGALVWHSSASHAHDHHVAGAIEKGAVCRSLSDPRYEVSCGKTAFGDIRYNCTEGRLGRCPETTAVSLRNVGRIPLRVSVLSGSGREGDPEQSPESALQPGGTVTVRPTSGDRFLYDVVVRSVRAGVGVVKVMAVD